MEVLVMGLTDEQSEQPYGQSLKFTFSAQLRMRLPEV